VANVFVIDAYAVPAAVEYRQVAGPSVDRLIVTPVVPAESVPDG
jgi:hypothetical protein